MESPAVAALREPATLVPRPRSAELDGRWLQPGVVSLVARVTQRARLGGGAEKTPPKWVDKRADLTETPTCHIGIG